MAIVADLSGNYPQSLPTGVDRNTAHKNRDYAGSPYNTLTPAYPGEIVLDTVSTQTWIAAGTSTTSWTPITLEG